MSIRRQLVLWIGLLILLIMSGNLFINVFQLKNNYEQQLKARADETVTTLALSMSHSALLEDDALLRSMIDVVFDRGHFSQIRFEYQDSNRLVVRVADQYLAPQVPNWFKGVMKLSAGDGHAHVSQGWHQLGDLTVRLNPGPMYVQLWRLVKAEIAWFGLMLFLAVYGLRLLLHWQLQPLKQVMLLVEKLAHNQFTHIDEKPKARELQSLVVSMNALSDRLHKSFIAHGETVSKLQQDNFNDHLTGLNNRKGWQYFLQDHMKEDNFSTGWMMLLTVENLTQLNTEQGKNLTDEVLMQMGEQLTQHAHLQQEHACLARTNGGEFWVFCPDPLDDQYLDSIKHIEKSLLNLSLVQQYSAQLRMAVLPVQKMVAPSSIKHQLDVLLTHARNQHVSLLTGEVQEHTIINWQHWQQKLKDALTQGGIELYRQPLFNAQGDILQQEIHCRLVCEGEASMAAGLFWPMVEKLSLATAFDRLIVKKWQSHFDDYPNSGDWVINLSGKSLDDEHFCQWFDEIMSVEQKQSLIIEFSEYTLVHCSEYARNWLLSITQQGIRLSVDHVGTSGRSFGFLARFPLHQGKVERRFIRDIHQDKENAFFVSGMVQVFRAQQTLCFAEGVESDAEKLALIDFDVDGVMGFGLQKPCLL
jgi:EAL domain-containing protein (putative c-di-GMP-specific phosphodiesterase class I)/GGDEF domain-containing protein